MTGCRPGHRALGTFLPLIFGVADIIAESCDLLVAEPDETGANGSVHLIVHSQSLQQRLELGIIRQVGVDNLFFGSDDEISMPVSRGAEFADQQLLSAPQRSWRLWARDPNRSDIQTLLLPAENWRDVGPKVAC